MPLMTLSLSACLLGAAGALSMAPPRAAAAEENVPVLLPPSAVLRAQLAEQATAWPAALRIVVQSATTALLDAHDAAHAGLQAEVPRMRAAPSQWCPNSSYWEFVPDQVGTVSVQAPQATVPGVCFTSVAVTVLTNATHAHVSLAGSGATTPLCSDTFLLATAYTPALLEVGELNPSGAVDIAFSSASEALDVSLNGVRVFVMPCGTLGSVASILATVSLFVSSDDATLQASNIAFMTQRKLWPSATPFNTTVALDHTLLRSGTYLAITRLDGLDPLVAFGTMGATGHSALVVWDPSDGQLYVTESTDANPFGRVYWPPPYGIIRHNWTTWVALAQGANYHVAVLQPSAAVAAAFNETAFWQWYAGVAGMPYGYHTFAASFLDTSAPFANLPQPMTRDLVPVVFNALDGLLANGSAGVDIFSLFTWGLNKRLNASCTTFACVLDLMVANQRAGAAPSHVVAALAIPEDDAWKYGANYSLVCSEYAARGWKAGLSAAQGVWAAISAGEQTPKDNYQMAIFDGAFFDASNCPNGGLRAAAGGSYCQLMGPYTLALDGFNTIPLYPGINNYCPSQWPDPTRCPPGNITCC